MRFGFVVLVTCIVWCFPADAHAQVTAEFQARIRTPLENQDVVQVLDEIKRACAAAENREATVAEREQKAREGLDCVRMHSTVAMASAKPETTFRIQQVVSALAEQRAYELRVVQAEQEFMGFKWGVGFGFSHSRNKDGLVEDADLVNNVVQIKSDITTRPRAVLEFHKYFWCNKKSELRGCGPFVALATASDKLLSGVAFGGMYGFRTKRDESDGFSIGAGAILDGGVKTLADGFVPGAPPPNGETTVRFVTKARWSFIVLMTRTF